MVLVDFGAAFNCSWGSQESQKKLFWGTLGRPFGDLGLALGVHFGGQGVGVPLDAFGGQSFPFQGRLVFSDFGAERDPKRLPKWT